MLLGHLGRLAGSLVAQHAKRCPLLLHRRSITQHWTKHQAHHCVTIHAAEQVSEGQAASLQQQRLSPLHMQAAHVSKRILATDAPVIVLTKQLMAGNPDALSLAQGAPSACNTSLLRCTEQ